MTKLRYFAVVLMLLSWGYPAWGAGLWNLPTTGRQYWGVGYGAGYHAPLVVGNPWRGTAASPGVSRVPAPLWHTQAVNNPFAPTSLTAPSGWHATTPEVMPRHRGVSASPLFQPPALLIGEDHRHLNGNPGDEIYLEPVSPAP